MNELIKAINENRIMDYISSNYYLYSKEDLKTIIVELAYQLELTNNIKESIISELKIRLEEV